MRLAWVRRRAVHEQELAAVLERDAHVRRQPADALEDELAQRVARHAHALDSLALVIAPRVEPGRVERGDGAVRQALHHDGARGGETAPRLERLGTGEDDVARDEELVEAPALGRREDRAERVEVAMNVGDAEEEHRWGREGG